MASNFLDSTIAQILEDIISQISFEGESHSNIADILLSILNQTPYDEEPKSVIADLFLKLKAKIEDEPFVPDDKEYTSNIAKILVSILNETEYTEEPKSRIAELLLELKEELESFIEVTVSGSVVSFNTKVSKPLVNLTADINPTETGTGEKGPNNPYIIGGHTKINITNANKVITDNIYTIEPIQDGTGDPSLTNIRPIHAGLTITRDDESTLEVYGGGLNIKTGVLTITEKKVDLESIPESSWIYQSNFGRFYSRQVITDYDAQQATSDLALFENIATGNNTTYACAFIDNLDRLFFNKIGYTEVEDLYTHFLNGHICVVTMQPTTIQLSATELERAKAALGIDIHTVKLVTTQESTKSGSIINISDSVGDPAKELTVDINAWQEGSGDPYPAGGSAQKWDEEWENGIYDTETGEKVDASNRVRNSNYIPVISGGEYYLFTPQISNPAMRLFFYDENKTYLSTTTANARSTITVPNNVYFMNFQMGTPYGNTYKNDVSINYPATDTSYHKYSNVRPIHGWSACKVTRAGKNQFDISNQTEKTYIVSTGEIQLGDPGWNLSDFQPVKPNAVYHFNPNTTTGGTAKHGYYDKDKNFISAIASGEQTFTTPNNACYMRFSYRSTSTDIMLNFGSTALPYEPYATPTIYTIQLGDTYYGCVLNVTSGVLTVKRKKVLFKNKTFTRLAIGSTYVFRAAFSDMKTKGSYNVSTDLQCECFKPGVVYSSPQSDNEVNYTANSTDINIRCDAYTTSTAFINAFGDYGITYNLATPIDIQLTPQQIQLLLDNNTLFADTGDMSITYDSYSGNKVYGGKFVCEEGEFDKVVGPWGKVVLDGTQQYITVPYRTDPAGLTSAWSYHVSSIPNVKKAANASSKIGLVCDKLKEETYDHLYGSGSSFSYVGISATNQTATALVVRVNVPNLLTLEAVNAWLAQNPITVYYPLETPTEIILPTKTEINTLLGDNNIYHDCNGDTTVTYLDKRF